DYAQGSGDYAITFSVGSGHAPNDELLSPCFQATMDAVEEALLNSVFAGVDTEGFEGRAAKGLPLDLAVDRLRAAGVLAADATAGASGEQPHRAKPGTATSPSPARRREVTGQE
ncbi:P1 family peptidase, partial [Leucobacter sp. M11]|uniref:P1 family peptidase n=1 Tax=Leucobacter sp. M11 TaxID=2993565 RepID=UPI002D80017B